MERSTFTTLMLFSQVQPAVRALRIWQEMYSLPGPPFCGDFNTQRVYYSGISFKCKPFFQTCQYRRILSSILSCIAIFIPPVVCYWFGNTRWFKGMWRGALDGMVRRLNEKGVKDTPYRDQVLAALLNISSRWNFRIPPAFHYLFRCFPFTGSMNSNPPLHSKTRLTFWGW